MDLTCAVACCDCSARLRTSAATTAKPFPCSPARAASTEAFSASMLDCAAISFTVAMISPICWVCSERARMFSAMDSTRSLIWVILAIVSSTACRPLREISTVCWEVSITAWARSVDCSEIVLTSSTVAVVCEMDADCSLAPATCCVAAAKISAAAEPRLLAASRIPKIIPCKFSVVWFNCSPSASKGSSSDP